jgi:hypothetical protein
MITVEMRMSVHGEGIRREPEVSRGALGFTGIEAVGGCWTGVVAAPSAGIPLGSST